MAVMWRLVFSILLFSSNAFADGERIWYAHGLCDASRLYLRADGRFDLFVHEQKLSGAFVSSTSGDWQAVAEKLILLKPPPDAASPPGTSLDWFDAGLKVEGERLVPAYRYSLIPYFERRDGLPECPPWKNR